MTTGKPQQMAADSNSSDDLIAELSKLMAQDAHGNRRDVTPPQPATPLMDVSARPESGATQSANGQITPFAVRIPGVPSSAAAQAPSSPVPRFEFGRPAEPVATIARQEPSFVPAAAPAVPSTDESAPFNFDFNFGQQSQRSTPEPQQSAPQPAPVMPSAPVMAQAPADDHDAIADLIAAELLGDAASPVAPVPVAAAEPVPAEPEPVPAAPEPTKASEPVKTASWAPTPVAPNLSDRPAQSRMTLRPVSLTPVQPNQKAASPVSDDTFRIPPVFGLGTTPPPAANVASIPIVSAPVVLAPEPAPAIVKPRAEHGYLQPVPSETTMAPPANDVQAELDPIDEIESLIGRAVRVELDNGREQQPAKPAVASPAVASPSLRALATPTAPQLASHQTSGADEAILAAAAATGAQIDWVNNEDSRASVAADEPSLGRERAPRRSGLLRAVAGPLVAVALLLAAGFGLYSVLGLGGTDGPAPVLVADTSPIKQVPAAKSPVEQLQQSVVFNEMNGVVPGAEEQLVSRDQADVNEVTAIPPSAAVTDEGLANRKVRTVTVRPDGSIVSGEDSVAGSAILPVDRPNVPAVPGAAAPSAALVASADATQPTPAPATSPVATAPVNPLVPGTEVAVVDAAGAPVAGKTAPVPYVRPASVGDAPARGPVDAIIDTPQASLQAPSSGQLPPPPAQNNLTAAVATANTQQPVQAASAVAQPTSNAPAYAQLSSQRSPEVAQQVANDLSARYASLLNGAKLEITRADLGARGTYYRVRVPAASAASAAQFCASVVASGGDCLAM